MATSTVAYQRDPRFKYIQNQLTGAGIGQMPQDVLGQAATTLSGGLKGELSQDVQNLIQQQAAEYGVATGMPGANISKYRGLRQLGLTSLDRIREAEGRVTPFFQTPYQTSQQQLQAAGIPNVQIGGGYSDPLGSATNPSRPYVGMMGGGQPAQQYPSASSLPRSPYGTGSGPLRTETDEERRQRLMEQRRAAAPWVDRMQTGPVIVPSNPLASSSGQVFGSAAHPVSTAGLGGYSYYAPSSGGAGYGNVQAYDPTTGYDITGSGGTPYYWGEDAIPYYIADPERTDIDPFSLPDMYQPLGLLSDSFGNYAPTYPDYVSAPAEQTPDYGLLNFLEDPYAVSGQSH